MVYCAFLGVIEKQLMSPYFCLNCLLHVLPTTPAAEKFTLSTISGPEQLYALLFMWSFGDARMHRRALRTPLVSKRVRNGVSPGLHPSISESLRSTRELASIPPAVPPTASSLANPPTGPRDIRNSVYSALRLVERQAHQELLAAL